MLQASSGAGRVEETKDFDFWFRRTFAPYVVHACASLACILVFVWTLHYRKPTSLHGTDVFNFHPLLQTVAFVLLIPESILLIRFSGFPRATAKPSHASLHALAVITAILGSTAVIVYKHRKDAAHFHTLHSWLGLTTMVLLLGQWAMGAHIFYWASGWFRSKMGPVHIHLGHLIVFTAAGALLTGMTERMIYVGACGTSLSRECALINSAGLLTVTTYAALGLALTAARQNTRRSDLTDGLLDEESVSVDVAIARS
jgi:cytochrome b-561